MPDLVAHFRMMARYNTTANQRLYAACAQLPDEEYRRSRRGSFESIERTLNHILVGDRIWLGRFTGVDAGIKWLGTILYNDFAELRAAREAEDARLERYCDELDDATLGRTISYRNSKGVDYTDEVSMLLSHLFNHQTHHRGQLHVMLSETGVTPISLDLHRIVHP